jgi:voltage-gated potassium channel
MKQRLYEILEGWDPANKAAHATHVFISVVILANVVAVILDSVPSIELRFHRPFLWFEYASIALFTAEYLLRIWVCTADERYSSPLLGRLRFALTPFALVDLLAIAPFYVPFISADLRVIRTMRLFRLARMFKLGRYSEAFRVLGRVLRTKREELAASLTVLIALLVIASTLMYEAEHAVQPNKFSSIPAAMWWAVVTLTTVGYGDVFPVTPIGMLVGGVMAVLGIGMFALPTGILGAGFIQEVHARGKNSVTCPHCGGHFDVGESSKASFRFGV